MKEYADEIYYFSPDRKYRYLLTRTFKDKGRIINFCMLNPSTADETQDDPTVRRCINYAKRHDFAQLVVTNIFAYRSTNPKALRLIEDPVGDDNDNMLFRVFQHSDVVVFAWGNHGKILNRGDEVRDIAKGVCAPYHLGLNKTGEPKHPLYLPNDIKAQMFWDFQ